MGTIRFVSISLFLITCCGIFSVSARQDQAKDAEFQKALDNAENLLRKKDIKGEIKELERAAKIKDGQCSECFRRIGRAYASERKYDDAVAAFRHSIELDPADEADITLEIGITLYDQNSKKSLGEADKEIRKAIQLNPSRMESAYFFLGSTLIKLGQEQEGKDALKECIRLRPGSTWATAAQSVLAGPPPSNGTAAREFKAASTTGDEITLEKYRGKIILLDFWATWCGPCRAELPNIKEIWKKHNSDQFVIIGVSLDTDSKKFNDYVAKERLTWPQYFDKLGWHNKIAQLYRVNAIPSAIVIDQNGTVHSVGLRGGKLAAEIDDLLKKLHTAQKS